MKLKINSCDGIYDESLDVRFTKACDNNCSFCIEKTGIDSLGNPDISKLASRTIETAKEDVLILGGEPFLFPEELLQYISLIRPYVKNIYITTSLPKTLDVSNPKILSILKQINGLNVSLHHYDNEVNNNILNASSKHNRIEILKQILEIPTFAYKVRVSVNLVNGFIDSKEEVLNYINALKQIGCKHIKLNELQFVSDAEYVSFDKIFGIKQDSPYSCGCQTNITDVLNLGIKITLKRSCFVVQDKKIAKAICTDFVKVVLKTFQPKSKGTVVLYEDGSLSNGWKQKIS